MSNLFGLTYNLSAPEVPKTRKLFIWESGKPSCYDAVNASPQAHASMRSFSASLERSEKSIFISRSSAAFLNPRQRCG